MATYSELYEKVESLKNAMVSRATGGFPDDEEYEQLRRELLANPIIKEKLPLFVRSCRTVAEFWDFIQPKIPSYRGRRQYLAAEFAPILSFLEETTSAPSDRTGAEVLGRVDSAHVREAWDKALERRNSDPEGAITSARSLLETVCKHILDESGGGYDEKADLPALYGIVAKRLSLAPSQHTESIFKQILGGCHSVVEGLGALRNRLSDAHGKSKSATKPEARHAQLAVNLAGSMATFLVATWELRKNIGQ